MPHLTLQYQGDAAILTFDREGSSANIFDRAVLTDLAAKIAEVAAKPGLKGVLFVSAKPSIFIAGADLKALSTAQGAELESLILLGQETFQKIAALKIPTVAAIHGACVGGGFELALACDWRIASDASVTKIGLPETSLGILPAWGGTTRLPRLLGLDKALPLILGGKILSAKAAKAKGLVDALVAPETLKSFALTWFSHGKRPDVSHQLTNNPISAPLIAKVARVDLMRKTRGLYPAPEAALDVANHSSHGPIEAGLKREREAIVRLAAAPQTAQLMRLFFLQDKAKKSRPVEAEPLKVGRCAVIGAGVMGAGIAYWLSTRGHDVVLRDVDDEALARGMKVVEKNYADALEHHVFDKVQAARGRDRVHGIAKPVSLTSCDLVIEAAVERMDIKKKIFADLATRVRPDTILATNTSALSIGELATVTPNPERLVGLHFFNPVHRMKLVEVIRTDATSDQTLATAVAFIRSLGKMPIVVKDSPGFLVNRILMPYLVEAARMYEDGSDPELLDRAMLDFGMPMGPLRLLDEVGLDVAYDVATTLAAAFPKRMQVPGIVERLLAGGHRGKKSGSGFYIYQHGKVTANPAALALRTGHNQPSSPFLQEILADKMSKEARLCLQEGVAASADDIDLAMILGTGYAPFRGGPMQYVNPVFSQP